MMVMSMSCVLHLSIMKLSKRGTLIKCFDECLKSDFPDRDCNLMIVDLETLVPFDEYPNKVSHY